MNLKREVEKGELYARAKARECGKRGREKTRGKEERRRGERGEGESVRKGKQGERRPEIER